MGFYVALSTNGTLIDEVMLPKIAAVGFDYLGISLDGLEDTHDRFRRRTGAFKESLHGLQLCRDAGIRVGMRYTLTRDKAADRPGLLALMLHERVDKFYLSHLNYAGRGYKHRGNDAHFYEINLLYNRIPTDFDHGRGGVPIDRRRPDPPLS